MRRRLTTLLCTTALLAAAGNASATPYRVAPGSAFEPEAEAPEPAGGAFEISPLADDSGVVPGALRIDDFVLELGEDSFGPRGPVDFEGLNALDLRIAGRIQFEGDVVTFAFFQAGGELIGADDTQVGFRFLEFRAEGPDAGQLVGELADGGPRRILLSGRLSEVDQYYRLPPEVCPVIVPPTLPPAPGGGGISIGGGGTIEIVQPATGGLVHDFEEFDIEADERVVFRAPAHRSDLRGASGKGAAALLGRMAPSGLSVTANLAGVPVTPSLAELGITAPEGAKVSYDGSQLTIVTSGELFIAGGSWDLPGLASVVIEAGGSITIDGVLELPEDSTLNIDALGDISGGISIGAPPPGPIVIGPPPVGIPFCSDLLPIFPNEQRELGTLQLVLSAAQPVAVEVRPRFVVPLFQRSVFVVIEGSDELDVEDVDAASLRFGPGEAAPLRLGHLGRFLFDVNRDGAPDLVVRFSVREAEIAFGDTQACLFGDTTDGGAIEGCDEIETRPPWLRRPRWLRPSR
jgi:hypothetical protein